MSTSPSKHTSSSPAYSSQPIRSTSGLTHSPNPSSVSVGSFSPTMAASKLRYAAYDPPPDPHLGLSRRGMTREAKSDDGRVDSHMSGKHGFSADQQGVMTAGELAAMGGSMELTRIEGTDRSGHTRSATKQVRTRSAWVVILGARMQQLILISQQEAQASPSNVQPIDLLVRRVRPIGLQGHTVRGRPCSFFARRVHLRRVRVPTSFPWTRHF